MLRVTPAQQRLEADDPAVGEAHLRLVVQLEFALVQSREQLVLQLAAGDRGIPHAALEHADLARPLLLRALQREVGAR